MKIINQHFSLLRNTLGWIQFGSQAGIALREYDPLLHTLESTFKSRGLSEGIAFAKAVRGNYLNYLSGNPERIPGVRLTNKGLPICLGPLLKYFDGSEIPREILQFLNTILFSSRALKTKASPNFNTITEPSKRGKIHYYGLFAADFWKALGYFHCGVIPRALKFRRFHLTTKSGPNGHALGTWYYDLFLLPKQLRESIGIIGGVKLKEFMDTALDLRHLLMGMREYLIQAVNARPRLIHGFPENIRRLVYFSDKEGKTRIIAILDYFSQTALRGLHSFLFRVLRKIPQDMTFDQGAFVEHVKDWPVLYSVDLSAATDRFPIAVISQVLRGHLPPAYVQAWEDIMVGYPFLYKEPHSEEIKSLRYAVGNPMGAYSSWASFSLAHHYIFYYISRLQGKPWPTLKYAVLGDDVLIGDAEVGELYLEIIHDLGVDVSTAKTHISKDLCEFAKRWIYKGQEISPFPVSSMRGTMRRYYLQVALLMEAEKKGWVWTRGIDQMVLTSLGRFKPKLAAKKFAKSLALKAYVTEQILRIIWGASPASHMTNIARQAGIRLSTYHKTDNLSIDILSNCFRYLFSESNPASLPNRRGTGLGLLAEAQVMFLTGVLEEEPRAMTLLDSPQLHAQGVIEQIYIDFIHLCQSRQYSPEDLKLWPQILRTVMIPLDDTLFVDKPEQTSAMGAARVGGLVLQLLNEVSKSPAVVRWHDYSMLAKLNVRFPLKVKPPVEVEDSYWH